MLALSLILLPHLVPATTAHEAVPCAACATWVVTDAQAAELLARSGSLEGIDVLVRDTAGGAVPAGLLGELQARGARAGLIVSSAGAIPTAARVARRVLIDPVPRTGGDRDRLAFDVKRMATEIHAANPTAAVGLETGRETWADLEARGVGPYLDFLARTGPDGASRDVAWPAWIPTAPPGPIETIAPAPDDGGRTIFALRDLRDVLPEGLTPLPAVDLSCPDGEGCATRVFLHPITLDAVAVVSPRSPARGVVVGPGARRVELVPLDRDSGAAGRVALAPSPAPTGVTVELPPGLGPFVLRIAGWSGGGDGRFSAGVEVVAERPLTVEEVIAQHQAAAARQRHLVRRLISSGSMVVTFQVPGLAAPMTVASDVVIYEGDASREIEQRSVRLNGAPYGEAAGAPRLPLLEPERVSAPPLAVTLDASYRYRLHGRETASGRDCYVVAFEPASRDGTLPRGRAWIEARGFGMVRMEAVQTGLRGPIVSSEQRDVFTAVPMADGVVWLPWRSEIHQVYEGPGHRTPIDRIVTLARLEPNPADFEARRAAAHASSSVMVADTASGLRYLRRVDGAAGAAGPRRETAGEGSRLRTLAAGVLVDPNIGRPLPFAGLGYVDFDFLGTGAQVNGFFGGVFAQLAWTVPSLAGSRWQAHGSGFAVLASYNDRAFAGGVERYDEHLRQRPARITAGAARPLWGRARLRVGYELDYTRLERGPTTAPEFVTPVSPVVHGVRLAIEARRGAWSGAAWWNGARRQRWAAWGLPGTAPTDAGFQRFGASAGRGFVLSPRTAARVDAAWMGGRGLDRFSRYAFDGFDNRLRGYPTATVRYDRGAVAHGVITWNVGRRLRLDGFLDAARVRDPGRGPRSRTYVGLGAALEAPLPAQAMAAVEWGYGFQARGREGETGTHVVRMTVYKVF